MAIIKKLKTVRNAGEDEKGLPFTAGENVSWYSHSGKL
jgi:hypothetical protein